MRGFARVKGQLMHVASFRTQGISHNIRRRGSILRKMDEHLDDDEDYDDEWQADADWRAQLAAIDESRSSISSLTHAWHSVFDRVRMQLRVVRAFRGAARVVPINEAPSNVEPPRKPQAAPPSVRPTTPTSRIATVFLPSSDNAARRIQLMNSRSSTPVNTLYA